MISQCPGFDSLIQVQTGPAHFAKELLMAIMCDSSKPTVHHHGMTVWLDQKLEHTMHTSMELMDELIAKRTPELEASLRLAMEVMDRVMEMRSENSRILTRSGRKRISPVALRGPNIQTPWNSPSEMDLEKLFNDNLAVGEKESGDWDKKLPALDENSCAECKL